MGNQPKMTFDALKEKFAPYANILLVIQLIEMKRTTMPVSGLRARLAPGTFPIQSHLAPVLETDGILAISLDTLTALAEKVAVIAPHELDWLDRTLRGLAEKVAAEDGAGRA